MFIDFNDLMTELVPIKDRPTLLIAWCTALASVGGVVPDNNKPHIRIYYTNINWTTPDYYRTIKKLQNEGLTVEEHVRYIRIWRNHWRYSSAIAKKAHRRNIYRNNITKIPNATAFNPPYKIS